MKVLLIILLVSLPVLQICTKLDESNPEDVLNKYLELKNDRDFKAAYELISSSSQEFATPGEYVKYYEKPDSLLSKKILVISVTEIDADKNSPSYKRFKMKGQEISTKNDTVNYLHYFTLKNEDSRWRIVWDNIIAQQASESYNKGDYDGAIKLLETATNLNPFDADAFEKIGWCYTRDETKEYEVRKDKIMTNFKYALSLEPDDANHYNSMAGYYSFINMPDLAIDSYNKGIDLALSKNEKYSMYANLSACYVAKKETDMAIEYLEKAIDCYADSPFAWYKYGNLLYDQGKYEGAKEKYEMALSLPAMENGLQSGLFYYYSKLCLKQYEYQKSKEYILKAIEMDPNNESYHDLYQRINNHTSENTY
mgnify:CR=1 FL=1